MLRNFRSGTFLRPRWRTKSSSRSNLTMSDTFVTPCSSQNDIDFFNVASSVMLAVVSTSSSPNAVAWRRSSSAASAFQSLCHVEAYRCTLAEQWCPARRVIAGNQQARGHAQCAERVAAKMTRLSGAAEAAAPPSAAGAANLRRNRWPSGRRAAADSRCAHHGASHSHGKSSNNSEARAVWRLSIGTEVLRGELPVAPNGDPPPFVRHRQANTGPHVPMTARGFPRGSQSVARSSLAAGVRT